MAKRRNQTHKTRLAPGKYRIEATVIIGRSRKRQVEADIIRGFIRQLDDQQAGDVMRRLGQQVDPLKD